MLKFESMLFESFLHRYPSLEGRGIRLTPHSAVSYSWIRFWNLCRCCANLFCLDIPLWRKKESDMRRAEESDIPLHTSSNVQRGERPTETTEWLRCELPVRRPSTVRYKIRQGLIWYRSTGTRDGCVQFPELFGYDGSTQCSPLASCRWGWNVYLGWLHRSWEGFWRDWRHQWRRGKFLTFCIRAQYANVQLNSFIPWNNCNAWSSMQKLICYKNNGGLTS